MHCLKCGREIPEEEVFCAECLAEASEYPVDPNTAVSIPRRKTVETVKKPVRRRAPSMDEQVKSLRKVNRLLSIALVLALLLAMILVYPAYAYLGSEHYRPGQNYTPLVTTPPASTSPAP